MRPEHHCSGNQSVFTRHELAGLASMRPEHHCSGNLSGKIVIGGNLDVASMRPEHHCSGNPNDYMPTWEESESFNEAGASLLRKSKRRRKSKPPTTSFNEAGASLLRKSREQRPGVWVVLGFNEAGASLLRKSRLRQRRRQDGATASMRPEHHCSGNLVLRPGFSIGRWSFNEAGASLLRKSFQGSSKGCPLPCFNEAGASLLRKS